MDASHSRRLCRRYSDVLVPIVIASGDLARPDSNYPYLPVWIGPSLDILDDCHTALFIFVC